MTELKERTCRNCGHRFTGAFCNLCGEKVITPDDRSVRHFLKNLLVAFTIVDSKFVQTLWMVFSKPGMLSREYVEGRRVPYIRPLSLFFVLNVLYFMLPRVQLFSASLRTQLFLTPYGEWIKEAAIRKMVTYRMEYSAFELIFDDKSTGIAKILIILFVLIATVPLSLLFRRSDRYFTDHAAFAIEMASFNLAVNALALNAMAWLLSSALSAMGSSLGGLINEASISSVVGVSNFYFLMVGARTFYQQKGWPRALKCILMLGLLFVSLQLYRFLLFWITLSLV